MEPIAHTSDDVDVIEKEEAFKGYFSVNRYHLRYRRYDGTMSDVVDREIFERGHAVAVLPYDPVLDRIVLIEQFRPGAYVAGMPPWQVEIVAGIIDKGQTPDAVAIRECEEEAGCHVSQLEEIATYLTTPGGSSETIKLYFGVCDSTTIPSSGGLDEEHEDIRIETVAADDVKALIESGKILNAVTLIALQWFLLHPEKRRQMPKA